MTESELVDELARRTRLSRVQAQTMMTALAAIACEQDRLGAPLPLAGFGAPRSAGHLDHANTSGTRAFVPSADEVEQLIAAAAAHPLGLTFLLQGDLCAVAIMFRTHAFTVDAARERIREQGVSLAGT